MIPFFFNVSDCLSAFVFVYYMYACYHGGKKVLNFLEL